MASTVDSSTGISIDSYPSDALPVGRVINGYKITSVLGRGTFGITYLAIEEQLDRLVAIKEYLPQEFATRDESSTVRAKSENKVDVFRYGRNSFLNEAKTQVKFKHPNIVRVLTFFELNDTAYIVMEYEEGISLDEFFSENPLMSQQALLTIFTPVMEGLQTVHGFGFIHRDIKPRNIHIRADGSPVLLDFGSARDVVTNGTDELTRILTHGYAPYEQENPAWASQGPWTDIYALGATLYMAVMGYKPESGSRRAAAYMSKSEDPYHAAAKYCKADYSQPFLRAIDTALAFYPKDRPQKLKDWIPQLLEKDEETDIEFTTDLISEDRRTPVEVEQFTSESLQKSDSEVDELVHATSLSNPALWMIPAILFGFISIGTGIYLLTKNDDNSAIVPVEKETVAITDQSKPDSGTEPAEVVIDHNALINNPVTEDTVAASPEITPNGEPAQQGADNDITEQPETTALNNAIEKETSLASNNQESIDEPQSLADIILAPDSGIEVNEDQLVMSNALENTLKYHTENVERQPDGTLVIYLDQETLYNPESEDEFSAEGFNLLNRLDYVFRNTQDFQILVTDRANQGYAQSKARGVRDFLVSQGVPWSRIQTVVNSNIRKNDFKGIEIQLIPKLPQLPDQKLLPNTSAINPPQSLNM